MARIATSTKETPFATRPARPAPSTQVLCAASLSVETMARLSPRKPGRNRCDNPSHDRLRTGRRRMNGSRALRIALAAGALLLTAAPVAEAYYRPLSWSDRKAAAVEFVTSRAGVESFAFIEQSGELRGYRRWRVAPSASVLKPMLMVAYLNLSSVRGRPLTDRDRNLLG